jgi:transposase
MQGTVKQQEKSRDQLAIETLKLLEENRLLKAQVQQLESQFKDRVVDYEKQLQGYEALIKLYEEAERLAKIQKYAASSEKSKFQFDVFDEAELEQALSDLEDQIDTEEAQQENRPARKKSRKKRTGFSPDLPRVRVELTLSDEEKAGATNTFFSRVKEELDIIPAQAQIIEYWQEKAVFGDEIGENTIVSAKRPVHPLGKSIASVALLAYVIVSKYADALPLYRLENILKRYGGSISRTTMANWIIRLNTVLMPLINLLREQQVMATYLQADETRVQVLKEDGKSAQSDKWMWLIRGGPPDKPVVLFNYDASRSQDVPVRLLDGFKGTLQTDGYAGYNKVCRDNGIQRIGCWDHARRKFVEASKAASPKKKGNKVSKADVAIGKIRKLYRIEDKIQHFSADEKRVARQELSLPILADLKDWLENNIHRVPKGSKTYNAIYYTLNQWDSLIGYCSDGDLRISNALAENAIRPFAVGRKNWLFSDTSRGAHASATCYSLIETAKANGLEPFKYIHHVLSKIGTAETVEDIEALLPWNVKL